MQSSVTQHNIELMLNEKLTESENAIKYDIEETIEEMKNGAIATDGSTCEYHIRGIRKNALSRYKDVKLWLNSKILDLIHQYTKADVLQALYKKNEEISEVEASKEKAEEEIKHIKEKELSLNDYNKYLLYSGFIPVKKRSHRISPKKDDNTLSEHPATIAIAQAYKNYITRRTTKILLGILVTIICSIADYSIIFSVFQSSNLSARLSMISATISAIALDLPPYILGFLFSEKSDCERLWFLRNEPNDPGYQNEIAQYKRAIIILLLAIIIIFAAYSVLRILLFFGGGDFNSALHFVFEGNFKFDTSVFNSSDLMSACLPFATSAGAFAIGVLLSSSYTEYVKTSVIIINKELNNSIKKYKKAIIDYVNKIDTLSQEATELKQSVWSFYIGVNKPLPDDNSAFITQVTDACKKLTFPMYRQVYQTSSAQVRENAIRKLQQINMQLAPYVTNQMMVLSMDFSDDETTALDDIWVVSDDTPQHPDTAKTLAEIESHIDQFQRMLKNNSRFL